MHSCTALSACALALAVVGCTPMPRTMPLESAAAEAGGLGEPIEFRTQREPIDALAPIGDHLSTADATRLALRHDPAIQAAIARVRQAQAESQQARLLPNPILSVALRFPEGGGKTIIEAGVAAELLSLLTRPGRISQADARLRAATADALAGVLDVLADVQRQYARTQALAARLRIEAARRQTLAEIEGVTAARQRAGEAARLDVLTAQSQSAQLRNDLLRLQAEERTSRLALARMIGSPSAAAAWTLDPWAPGDTFSEVAESDWIRTALQHRPEIQAATWELSALGEAWQLTRLAPFEGGDVGVDAEKEDQWTLGPAVSVPLPLFDLGQAAREAARFRLIEQRHLLTQLERQVVEEIRSAHQTLQLAFAAYDQAHRELIPLQEQRLQQARDAYRLGLADVLALRLAEQDLQQARADLVELQQQVSEAQIDLVRAAGGTRATAHFSRPATTQSTKETP